MKDYLRVEQAKRDIVAREYDDWYVQNKGALFDACERQSFVRAVGSRPASRVLDLGCGTGRIAAALKPSVGGIVGADLSVESLRVFRTKVGLPAAAADAGTGLPLRDASFEVVTCSEVLNRLESPEVERAVAECHRILRAGGRLLFSVYNDRYWRSPRLPSRPAQRSEAQRFSAERMSELARRTGYIVERVSFFKAVPYTRLHHRAWLTVDRVACRLPVFGPRLGAYTLYAFRKPTTGV